MFISDFAIKRPVVTVVTMLALSIFGIVALLSLDTDEFPEINPPFIFVSVPYPGASPDVVEREVVDPIEEAIAGISGVDRITSQSLDGFGSVLVEFVFEKDVQQASQDIRDAISQIRGDLPQEMEEPILARFDPNDQPGGRPAFSGNGMIALERVYPFFAPEGPAVAPTTTPATAPTP